MKLFSCWVMSDSSWPCGPQHTRLPCASLSPGVCSDLRPLSWWYYLTISSSAALFFFCLQSFPPSGSFPMSLLFASGGQSIGISASASVLPMNIQGWFPWGFAGLTSLQSKGLLRVFSSTTILQYHNFGWRDDVISWDGWRTKIHPREWVSVGNWGLEKPK